MKRILCLALLAAMLVCTCLRVSADETVPNFAFELTANGAAELEAKPGDILTVTLRLVRTDSTEPVSLQAMQDEITYDSAFFSLEDGGALAASGVVTQEISLRDGNRAYYMNYLALGGAERWEADTTVGVFRLKVIGESGASVIESRNFLVSGTGGEGSCTAEARNVTVRVSPECTVHFDSGEGSAVSSQTVASGEMLRVPDAPTREGYVLEGWYRDFDCTQPWDFEKDAVCGNMTLYAGWMTETAAEQAALPQKTARLPVWPFAAAACVLLAGGVGYLLRKRRTAAEKPSQTGTKTKP